MDIRNLDWSLVQVFLAVAETGSLSAAARKTGQSQPTVGRQIKAVEAALGLPLFIRQSRGLALNESGARLLAHAQIMQNAAAQITLEAAGQSRSLEGEVRITASVLISHHYLPKILADIHTAEPNIELVLLPNDATENLLFREADIAIRLYRPTQEDIIAKKLGAFSMGLFAHRDYLKKRGTPQSLQDFGDHDFVGFDQSTRIIDAMKKLGISTKRQTFKIRCDQQANYWELVRAGCGIGPTQTRLALQDSNIVQVLPQARIDPLPVWLAAPNALRNTPRIRIVYDMLAKALQKLTDA